MSKRIGRYWITYVAGAIILAGMSCAVFAWIFYILAMVDGD